MNPTLGNSKYKRKHNTLILNNELMTVITNKIHPLLNGQLGVAAAGNSSEHCQSVELQTYNNQNIEIALSFGLYTDFIKYCLPVLA